MEFGRPIPLAELSIGSARINQQPNQHVVDFQIVDADCRLDQRSGELPDNTVYFQLMESEKKVWGIYANKINSDA